MTNLTEIAPYIMTAALTFYAGHALGHISTDKKAQKKLEAEKDASDSITDMTNGLEKIVQGEDVTRVILSMPMIGNDLVVGGIPVYSIGIEEEKYGTREYIEVRNRRNEESSRPRYFVERIKRVHGAPVVKEFPKLWKNLEDSDQYAYQHAMMCANYLANKLGVPMVDKTNIEREYLLGLIKDNNSHMVTESRAYLTEALKRHDPKSVE